HVHRLAAQPSRCSNQTLTDGGSESFGLRPCILRCANVSKILHRHVEQANARNTWSIVNDRRIARRDLDPVKELGGHALVAALVPCAQGELKPFDHAITKPAND